MLSVKLLSLEWVREFLAKMTGAGQILAETVLVCSTLAMLMDFLHDVEEDETVDINEMASLRLRVSIPSSRLAEDGKRVAHRLSIDQSFIPVHVVLEALAPLVNGYTRAVKTIEEDSGDLQKLLGAINAFEHELKIPTSREEAESMEDKNVN